jgi:hypothetical protein
MSVYGQLHMPILAIQSLSTAVSGPCHLPTQAGCEESLAAVQDALRCLQPTQVAIGYVHLAAAAVVGAMAQV